MLLNEAKVHQQLPFRHSHQVRTNGYPDTFSTNNRQYGVLPYNGNGIRPTKTQCCIWGTVSIPSSLSSIQVGSPCEIGDQMRIAYDQGQDRLHTGGVFGGFFSSSITFRGTGSPPPPSSVMTVRSSSHHPTRLSLPARRCANACSVAASIEDTTPVPVPSAIALSPTSGLTTMRLGDTTRFTFQGPEPSAAGARSNAIHDTAAAGGFFGAPEPLRPWNFLA
eukprot:g59120.t1